MGEPPPLPSGSPVNFYLVFLKHPISSFIKPLCSQGLLKHMLKLLSCLTRGSTVLTTTRKVSKSTVCDAVRTLRVLQCFPSNAHCKDLPPSGANTLHHFNSRSQAQLSLHKVSEAKYIRHHTAKHLPHFCTAGV